MKKIREIIRLEEQAGLSHRRISQAIGVSRPVVAQTIGRARECSLNLDIIQRMSDSELSKQLTEPRKALTKAELLARNFPKYALELKKPGVTLQLLWDEYVTEKPGGLKYTQFCFHYQKWRENEKISMHVDHKPGDKMFVDYTGRKMEITSPLTRTSHQLCHD